MNDHELHGLLTELADEFDVPGVAAGVWHLGKTSFACHGVTSIENPLPIDVHTLFQAGSIGKTFTATALLMLAETGRVGLDAPVRRYVPELHLADATAAAEVTLLQLLNHTAGWEGDFFADTGEGDDALARYVACLDELEQRTPPGVAFSYNNAAFCLAGRVIESVTGEPYERAIRRLILRPLGLRESFFFPNEIMTRRFVVGHKPSPDDALQVARPWALPRNGAPAGGIVTSIVDLLAWARFHSGDGRGANGVRVLSESGLRAMRDPTVHMSGSAFGGEAHARETAGETRAERDVVGFVGEDHLPQDAADFLLGAAPVLTRALLEPPLHVFVEVADDQLGHAHLQSDIMISHLAAMSLCRGRPDHVAVAARDDCALLQALLVRSLLLR